MGRIGFSLIIGMGLLWGLAGCGGGEPDPNATITNIDFDGVCKGEPLARAAAYDAAGAAPHTVIVMTDSTIGAEYDEYFSRFISDIPADWVAQIVEGTFDYSTVQLVTCVHRSAVELIESCEFEDDYVLNTHASTYELTLRAAQSGEVVAQETVTNGGECPTFHMFTEGETNEDYFTDIDDEQILAFIEPYVAP